MAAQIVMDHTGDTRHQFEPTDAREAGIEGAMGNDATPRLVTGSLEQLGHGLSRLLPERSGYITAEDFERLTGEELNEFSAGGRRMVAELALQHWCTIRFPPIERRIYFTTKQNEPHAAHLPRTKMGSEGLVSTTAGAPASPCARRAAAIEDPCR
jgi:hypothetical protein